MLTRIISAAVGIVLFVAVTYFLPPVFFSIMVALICAIAAYELTLRSGIVKSRALFSVSAVSALLIPLLVSFEATGKYITAVAFAALIAVFVIWLSNSKEHSLSEVLTSYFAAVILPVMFSAIILIFRAENGKILILVPFLASWMTDTGAYFIGVFFGRHKLCERVSPKKTIEGSIGGTLICVISLLVFGKIAEINFNIGINYILFAVAALVLSLIAQLGDLSFSLIKREYNIKDYGNIMPGHGGVLDRFDSAAFTIPATYILLFVIGGILI